MTEIERRRRSRRWVVLVSAVLALAGLVALAVFGQLDKDLAGVIAAFLSVIAAAAAWEATGRASDTAEEAHRTSEVMARIESDRWHHEFTPEISISADPVGHDKALIHLSFSGPAIHQEVESLSLTIIDDGLERRPGITHGLTAEQIENQIWGPYRFEGTNEGVSEDGRTVPAFALRLGQQKSFFLAATTPPGDYPAGNWTFDYGADVPIRLRVECRVPNTPRPWAFIREVRALVPPWEQAPANP